MKNGGFHSWYDGFVYDKLFTPLTTWLMDYISEVIPDKSTVLEVGCGPGSLALELSGKCAYVTGIDLSGKMIAYAMKRKAKMGITNIDFLCVDAAGLSIGPAHTDGERADRLNKRIRVFRSGGFRSRHPERRPSPLLLREGRMGASRFAPGGA
jgi:SAM-dependent methyltransferase